MRCLVIFSLLVLSSSAFGGFTENELSSIRQAISTQLIGAFEGLTNDDKLVYERATNGQMLQTLLTDNERIVHFTSTLISVIGKKVARLIGDAKTFAMKTLEHIVGLVQKVQSGGKIDLDVLATREEKRFRALLPADRKAIKKEFPVLTNMGLFTNDKLKKIFADFVKDSRKQHQDL